MKLVFILVFDSSPQYAGVLYKTFSQIRTLISLGIDAELVLVGDKNRKYRGIDFINYTSFQEIEFSQTFNIFSLIKRNRNIHRELKRIISRLGKGDIIYFRFPSLFKYHWTVLNKTIQCRIISEHQSKELDEIRLTGSWFKVLTASVFNPLVRKRIDGFVGVTDEIVNYQLEQLGDMEKPHITIRNGFDVRSVKIRKILKNPDNRIDILCVANVSRWHGLDRLIRGMAVYTGKISLFFHIVGEGDELPVLKDLVQKLKINNSVIFHGYVGVDDLDAIFDQCHIAVGSLGIHRKGLTETSELKCREYTARGIPFIIGCTDADFPPTYPYIMRVPADETIIDLEELICFTVRAYEDTEHPVRMREYAEKNLDWSVKLGALKQFFEMIAP